MALVTGANKGIGLETVRQLAGLGITVYLGTWDAAKGQHTTGVLKAMGLRDAPLVDTSGLESPSGNECSGLPAKTAWLEAPYIFQVILTKCLLRVYPIFPKMGKIKAQFADDYNVGPRTALERGKGWKLSCEALRSLEYGEDSRCTVEP